MIIECPDPDCRQPAWIVRNLVLESTDGPIEHRKTRCIRGHWFLMPTFYEVMRHGDDQQEGT